MAISSSFVGSDLGPESRRSTQASEIWRITGATGVATDTCTITPRQIKTPVNVIGGPCTFTVSSGVITITLKADIGNGVFDVEVKGGI